MALTFSDIIETVTREYLETLDPDNAPTPKVIEAELLAKTNDRIETENVAHRKKAQIAFLKQLTHYQLAMIMLKLHTVRRIAPAGFEGDQDLDLVAMYQHEGPDEGIYIEAETVIRKMVRRYDVSMSTVDFKEIISILGDEAERVERCEVAHYAPVKNGIYDAEQQVLLPFSPDLVWLAKSDTAYNPNAVSPVIVHPQDGSSWEFHEWLMDLANNNPEVYQLLLEINSALMFPNRRYNKFIAPFATSGNNGKGTINEMWRALVGRKAVSGLDIAGFDKEFPDESLVRAHAVIADENAVGAYLDKVSNFKAACTGDVIPMNRKFKRATAIRFRGLIIEPLNSKLRLKDKSDSFWRRALMIPFDKNFTGAERGYIKSDYVQRQDVLEYVLKEALHLNVQKLSCPAASAALLSEQKTYNDPVRAFWEEIEEQLVWDMVPFRFLYDLFTQWSSAYNPTGRPVARTTFVDDLIDIVADSGTFYSTDKSQRVRPSGRMSNPEPLIAEYELTRWMNPMARGSNDVNKKCLAPLAVNYTGALMRYGTIAGVVGDVGGDGVGADEDDGKSDTGDGDGEAREPEQTG